MAYSKTSWVDDSEPAINAANLNNIENGVSDVDSRVKALEDAPAPAVATWENLDGKPAVIAAGADAAAARTAIGAGTGSSNLTLGTTASTAAAGNHSHADLATKAALDALTARVAALETPSGE